MSNDSARPGLDELLLSMGTAGLRVAGMDASEASAGNISLCIDGELHVQTRFPIAEDLDLPLHVPALAGRTILVTGSGRRLRDIQRDPEGNVGAVVINTDGASATLFTAAGRLFANLTSEFNSHLAVHEDQVERREVTFHAVAHAQPPLLTYLSHIARYRDQAFLNARLIRWEPESIVALPDGVAVLEFMVPGSAELMSANVAALRDHTIVLWSKHGVMARSDSSATNCVDRIEYAETGAKYELMNLQYGEQGEGLTIEELRHVKDTFAVRTTLV
jgi:rhamnulose-1-phosphate aldolase